MTSVYYYYYYYYYYNIEIGITDTDIVKERYNHHLHESSLFYLILLYFIIVGSASFGYLNSKTCLFIGNEGKFFDEYRNPGFVKASVEVDMLKFFLFFFLYFYFICIHLTILIMQRRRTVYFFDEEKLIPICGKNLPKSVNFAVFYI
jgi:hypothetical protein